MQKISQVIYACAVYRYRGLQQYILEQDFKRIQKYIGFCLFLNKVNDNTCVYAMFPTLNTDRDTPNASFLEE